MIKRLMLSLLIVVILFLPLSLVFADIQFERGGLSDPSNILGSGRNQVLDALETLYDETGSQMFVALTQEPNTKGLYFDQWVESIYREESVGPNDLLLVIDTKEREFSWTVDENYKLSDDALQRVMNEQLIPQLRNDNWAQAIVDAAGGLRDAFSSPTGGGGLGGLIRPLLILLVIGVILFMILRRRKRGGTAVTKTPQVSLQELEKQAGLQLVEVDDAIQSSEQELAFTEAEFGNEAVREFRKTLAEAKDLLSTAFGLQQKLYDVEDNEPEKRRLLEEIIRSTSKADELLDEKADGFKELRNLVGRVDQAIGEIESHFATVKADFPSKKTLLTQLKASYSKEALGEVYDDDEQAEELLSFTEERLEHARESIELGDNNQAAVSLRAAEDATYQIDRYGQAILQMDRELQDAESNLRNQINYVRELTSNKTIDKPELAAELARAKTMADSLERELASRPNNPIGLLSQLEQSVQGLEESLKGYQEQQRAKEQNLARVQSAINNTQNRIASVDNYVYTRRGHVGSRARALLQEAKLEVQNAAALLQRDPNEAYQHAARARSLADQASQLAQGEVREYNQPQATGGGLAGDLIKGAILSGILRGGFGGGGNSRSSGGFGGGSFRTGGFGGTSRGGFSGGTRSGRGRF